MKSANVWLQGIGLAGLDTDLALNGLTQDSREIMAGDAFVAMAAGKGVQNDHIHEAIARGASLIVRDDLDERIAVSVPVIYVPDLRTRLSAMAAAYYDLPGQSLQVMAVTGTNGKTSTAHWMAQSWHALNLSSGMLGTLGNGLWGNGLWGNGLKGHIQRSTHTTLEPIRLQRTLRELVDQGMTHLAMEASSHGLAQFRMEAVPVHWAVFTNLSRDHLDYHGSMDAYAAAKARLFLWPTLKGVVLNADDAFTNTLRQNLQSDIHCLTFGSTDSADLCCLHVQSATSGLVLQVRSPWGSAELQTQVFGLYNVGNLLAVLGVLLVQGVAWEQAVGLLTQLQPVRGRMQVLRIHGKPKVVVDYAHTPDALQKLLADVRSWCTGRIRLVFGCGGDRDPGKRPLMGSIATQFADEVWLTSDNPRTEDPLHIIAMIEAGCDRVVQVQPDRYAAIREAIFSAASEDVVVVAGKGHEDYQEVMGKRHPFDDVRVAGTLLEANHETE